MVVRRSLLDDRTCAATCDAVLALRARWIRRMPEVEFFTLGAASYLDREPDYTARLVALNPVLRAHFASLHAAVTAALAEIVEEPVELASDKALPGFHVWGVPGIPTEPVTSLHFDLQFEHLAWPDAVDLTRTLSFTLPLRLPRGGGGLSLWDTTKDRVDAFYCEAGFRGTLNDLTLLLPEHFEPYRCGELVIHSGLELHRIAPVAAVVPDDLRVTLQGHGLRVGNRWQIYW
jgi:hypothetical protein